MRKNVFFLLLLLLLLLTLSGCGDSIAPETEKVSLTALQYELENHKKLKSKMKSQKFYMKWVFLLI